MLENFPGVEYAMSFFDGPLVPGAESSKAWLDIVVNRKGSVSGDWYVGEDVLRTFVADFQFVNDRIQDQSRERMIVSYAVLVASAMQAGRAWLCSKFSTVLPDVHFRATPETSFFKHVIIPSTKMTPVLNMNLAYVCDANSDLLQMIEERSPAHMPCGIWAFKVNGFWKGQMTTEEKFRVVTSIQGPVSVQSVAKAVGEPVPLSEAVVEDDVQDTTVTDFIVDGMKVTERREHDSYINVSMLLRRANTTPAFYLRCIQNTRFIDSFRSPEEGKKLIELPLNKECGSAWAHPKVAKHMARWCGQTAVADILGRGMDDTVPVVAEGEDDGDVAIEVIEVGRIMTSRRSTDNYIQGSSLCKSIGVKWANFTQSGVTRKAFADISKRTGVAVSDLVFTAIGVKSGVWIHPDVAIAVVEKHLPEQKQALAAALAAPFEAAPEFVKVRNDDGSIVSRVRVSDGFHDADFISNNAPQKVYFSRYRIVEEGRTLIDRVYKAYGKSVVDVTRGTYGGTWVHPRIARGHAQYCGSTDLDIFSEPEVYTGVNIANVAAGAGVSVADLEEALRDSCGVVITEIRAADGFVNSTKICAAHNMQWGKYTSAVATKAFFAGLSADAIENRRAGSKGMWVHPKVAIHLSRWCKGVKKDNPVSGVVVAGDVPSEGANTSNEVVDAPSSAAPEVTIVNTFEITEADDGYMLNGVKIRKTNDVPARISVYDIVTAITGQPYENAHKSFARMADAHPDIRTGCPDIKFPGRKQKPTPSADARGVVMIMNLLPGQQAAQFRLKAADVMVRYLGGDPSLIAEIQRNAAAQDALPESNIGRIFGDAVASSSKAIVPYDKDVALTPDDLTRPPPDERNNIVPLAALAPNMVYIICLGLSPDGTHEVGMFGLTQNGKVRVGQHTVVFPYCKVTCVITCGRYNPAPIENALSVYFAANKVSVVGSRGVTSRECFGEMAGPAADALYSGAIELVKSTMHEIVDSITYCNATEYFSPSGGRASDAALLEQERTRQKTLELEIAREKAQAAREMTLFEASPQMYMQYMATRYGLAREPKQEI
jgi:hypothetical protein